jgi:hypothetical protein
VVVPAGVLATVPWAVLPGCAGRPVTVTPSATFWHAARQRLASARARGAAPPNATAGPPPSARPGTPPGASPAAPLAAPPAAPLGAVLVAGPGNERGEAEVQAIAAFYPGSCVLTGDGATPAAALAALGTAAVAHIAAHGQHQAENALFSTLELAGGPLLGYDVQRLPAVPSMVVLSACDLGLTDVRPGDETFGMVTALLDAGASTVIGSVARVADDTAMTVMAGYHRAVTAGVPPSAALAAALEPAPAAGFACFGAG